MSLPDDPQAASVLASFGLEPGRLLGYGSEARVYALDANRVVRIHHPAVTRAAVARRATLLAELGRTADRVPFSIPEILESATVDGRYVSIERRLPGIPLSEALEHAPSATRAALIRAYLEAAAGIGDLVVERPYYGDLCRRDPIRTRTFRRYLERRAALSLAAARPRFPHVDPAELAAALPEPSRPALVHLDAYAGNMLVEGGVVTAVIDFGAVSISGDRRLEPLFAAAYLTPPITPTATDADRAVAREWLVARGLDELYPAARRWSAAFWSAGMGHDDRLRRWCGSVLAASRSRSGRSG